MPNTLSKAERLKSRKVIDALFEKGKSFTIPPYRVVYLQGSNGVQFGVGVSKKFFKRAVDRNKVKRQTREAYRLQKQLLTDSLKNEEGLSLFLLYNSKEIISYEDIYTAIQKVLIKLSKA